MSKLKFLEEHDPKVKYPIAIKAALAEIRKGKSDCDGPEGWRYEVALSKLSGVPLIFLQKLRSLPEFAKHVVDTPRTHSGRVKYAWFVEPKVAAEMRTKLKESL